MTKEHEINLLDSMINKFGPHSYLGPWLAEHRETIIRDISNDITPAITLPGAAYKRGAHIIQEANAEAETIKTAARTWATELREKARKDAEEFRHDARRELAKLLDRI